MEQNHNGDSKTCWVGGEQVGFLLGFFTKYCHTQHSSNEEFKKEISSRSCLLKLILSSRNFLLSSSFNQDMDMAYLIKMGLQDFPFLYRKRDKKKNQINQHITCDPFKTTSYILNFKKGSLLKKHLEWVPQFLFVGFLKKINFKYRNFKIMQFGHFQ